MRQMSGRDLESHSDSLAQGREVRNNVPSPRKTKILYLIDI